MTQDEDSPIIIPELGTAKVALQRHGLLDLEREIDDELDPETWTALYTFAQEHSIEWSDEAYEAEDGQVPQEVMDAVLDSSVSFSDEDDEELIFDDYPDRIVSFDEDPLDLSKVEVFDVTGEHELKKGNPKRRRKPERITTIMLHQTAIKFGTTARNRKKYGERDALHRRFYHVACHAAALMNGDTLLVNDWQSYVYHGNSGNRSSIGIEIEGLYAGLEGNLKTVWKQKQPHTLSMRTIASARKAVQLAVEWGRDNGASITTICAHRSYSNSRIADPGQEIWREVALWAVDTLGLQIDYDLKAKDKGRKIPREWDPKGKVNYRGKPID